VQGKYVSDNEIERFMGEIEVYRCAWRGLNCWSFIGRAFAEVSYWQVGERDHKYVFRKSTNVSYEITWQSLQRRLPHRSPRRRCSVKEHLNMTSQCHPLLFRHLPPICTAKSRCRTRYHPELKPFYAFTASMCEIFDEAFLADFGRHAVCQAENLYLSAARTSGLAIV
jgi:hypothetical protein